MGTSELVRDVLSCSQVTRIDGTVDSPPCLKVTHKTFGTQNSNADMVFCRLSMPVEFHSHFKCSPVVDMNGVHEEDALKVKHRYSPPQSHCEVLIVTEVEENADSSRLLNVFLIDIHCDL